MPTRARAALLCLAALTLAACSAKPPILPPPPPNAAPQTNTSPTVSKDRTYGAPSVANPLDAARFIEDPCLVLTAAQRETLNVAGSTVSPGSTICRWKHKDNGEFDLSFSKNGLSEHYQTRAEGHAEYFEPTTVSGYPAVFHDTVDYREKGQCYLAVGVTDTLTFDAYRTTTEGRKACDDAKELATLAIYTIKNGR